MTLNKKFKKHWERIPCSRPNCQHEGLKSDALCGNWKALDLLHIRPETLSSTVKIHMALSQKGHRQIYRAVKRLGISLDSYFADCVIESENIEALRVLHRTSFIPVERQFHGIFQWSEENFERALQITLTFDGAQKTISEDFLERQAWVFDQHQNVASTLDYIGHHLSSQFIDWMLQQSVSREKPQLMLSCLSVIKRSGEQEIQNEKLVYIISQCSQNRWYEELFEILEMYPRHRKFAFCAVGLGKPEGLYNFINRFGDSISEKEQLYVILQSQEDEIVCTILDMTNKRFIEKYRDPLLRNLLHDGKLRSIQKLLSVINITTQEADAIVLKLSTARLQGEEAAIAQQILLTEGVQRRLSPRCLPRLLSFNRVHGRNVTTPIVLNKMLKIKG